MIVDIKWTNGKIGEHESYQMIVNEMLLFITRMKKFILIRGIFITSLITFVQKWNMTELGIV